MQPFYHSGAASVKGAVPAFYIAYKAYIAYTPFLEFLEKLGIVKAPRKNRRSRLGIVAKSGDFQE